MKSAIYVIIRNIGNGCIFSFGVDYATALCRKLLDSGEVFGLHIYTLNLETASIQILKNLGKLYCTAENISLLEYLAGLF